MSGDGVVLMDGLDLRHGCQILKEVLLALFGPAAAEFDLKTDFIIAVFHLPGHEIVNAGILALGVGIDQIQNRGNIIGFQHVIVGHGVVGAHQLVLDDFQNGQGH